MILSKWTLTAKEFAIESNYNNYLIHQKICRMFNETTVLFDVNIDTLGNANIYIQSINELMRSPLYGEINSKSINMDIITESTYHIKVKLNCIKQIKIEGKKNNKKIPIIGSDNVTKWLHDKQSKFGIMITDVNVSQTYHTDATKCNNIITCAWHDVSFDCSVVNLPLFKEMMINGIGSQKSFGYGMIKIFKQTTTKR